MNIEDRLNYVFDGYSPNCLGEFTRTLNQMGIAINETRVSEALGPILVEENPHFTRVEQSLVSSVADAFANTIQSGRKPDRQSLEKAVAIASRRARWDVDPERLANLTNYIDQNWDELSLHSTDPAEMPRPPEDVKDDLVPDAETDDTYEKLAGVRRLPRKAPPKNVTLKPEEEPYDPLPRKTTPDTSKVGGGLWDRIQNSLRRK